MTLVRINLVIKITYTQPAFICPKSTTETLERRGNYTQGYQ